MTSTYYSHTPGILTHPETEMRPLVYNPLSMSKKAPKAKRLPIALSIAGSDSGGGAGIQADLKTFASLGVHGTSVVTCVTAQNPKEFVALQTCRPDLIGSQLDAVFSQLPPHAVKIGMLYSDTIVDLVATFFRSSKRPPMVVDPMMISSSGFTLLKPKALTAIRERLFPISSLITPNLPEAASLLERPLRDADDLSEAARELHFHFGCAVVVKGGHLAKSRLAVDAYYDGANEFLVSSPYSRGRSFPGTGCCFSSAITAFLALGHDLPRAVKLAKEHMSRCIVLANLVGKHKFLNYCP